MIGGVVAQARGTQLFVRIGDVADAHIQHRPVPGRKADARAIRVVVVRRPAELRMIAGVVRIAVPRLGVSLPGLAPVGVGQPLEARVVLIDHVGERRHQHGDLRSRLADGRHDEEGDVLLGVARFEHQRVGPGPEVGRHRPFVRRRPAAIDDIVIVKMDGRILVRGMPPAHLAAGPRRPRDGPRRHVVQGAVKPVRANVDDPGAGDLLCKVPARDQARQHFTLRCSRDLARVEDAVEQHRALDATVERDPSAIRLGRPDQDIRTCGQHLPAGA